MAKAVSILGRTGALLARLSPESGDAVPHSSGRSASGALIKARQRPAGSAKGEARRKSGKTMPEPITGVVGRVLVRWAMA